MGFINQLTPLKMVGVHFVRATLSEFRICDEFNVCVICISVVLPSRERYSRFVPVWDFPERAVLAYTEKQI